MGVFARGELPGELEAAAFALAAGQTSGVVQRRWASTCCAWTPASRAREPSFEECARPRSARSSCAQKSDERRRDFVPGLLARAKVNHEAAEAPAQPF